MRKGRRTAVAAAAVAALAACTAPAEPGRADPAPSAAPGTVGPRSPAASDVPGPGPAATEPAPLISAAPPHPVSLDALSAQEYDGRGLRLVRRTAVTDAYTQHDVTYRSGDLTVTGRMNVPHGRGPHPALVLAHGYIDPAVYVSGQGLAREQDHLARRGYVTLHVDYRNHAGSSREPRADLRMRLGYTEDVVNAVLALRRGPRWVDGGRIGLLGRSMGGGVVYNVLVVAPDLVDAAVVHAPVSSDAVDNFERWTRPDPERSGLAARIIDRYGAPEDRPGFWRRLSPRTYFDRVQVPLRVHHGTSDDSCPIRWSHRTVAALERAGKDVRLHVYEGEEHAFVPQWGLAMRRTTAFFDRTLHR